MADETQTDLGVIEIVYRAHKAKNRRDAAMAVRSQTVSKIDDINSKIIFDDPTKPHDTSITSESQASPELPPRGFRLRKFFPAEHKGVQSMQDLDRYHEQHGNMSERSKNLCTEQLSQGASTTEAVKRGIKRPKVRFIKVPERQRQEQNTYNTSAKDPYYQGHLV